MKKIIAMAVTAITMLSATFALNLELVDVVILEQTSTMNPRVQKWLIR